MKATKNGWTVEGTPREIAELIGMVPVQSIYETPEAKRPLYETPELKSTRNNIIAISKGIKAQLEKQIRREELERRGKNEH